MKLNSILKIYIAIIIAISLAFLALNVLHNTQAQQAGLSFCSKTESLSITPRITSCANGFHIEGNVCAPNNQQPDPLTTLNWLGNTFNGIMAPFAICGNGAVEPDEECDDGNANNNDACDNTCHWTLKEIIPITYDSANKVSASGDGVVYDNNANPNSATDQPDGTYLKVASVMPTPYIWIANSNLNQISKIRTYPGLKRTIDGWVQPQESRGQLIGIYNVGINPSRTAINVETGDVWVANRGVGDTGVGSSVMKLDIAGTLKKTCTDSSILGARGLAIEVNGDVWVANMYSGKVIKISGDDSNCNILANISLGTGYSSGPYGLAVDSNNNIWVSNRGIGKIQKIDTTSDTLVASYSVPGFGLGTETSCGDAGYAPYGITVDLEDNVWVADTCNGVYKLTPATGIVTHQTFAGLNNSYGRSRGVTIDTNGSIWIAMDYSSQVVKIPSVDSPATYSKFTVPLSSYPATPAAPHFIGIAGDSSGQIWAINFALNNASVFDASGNLVWTYPVRNDLQDAQPYTYSDMTGLNRALILRSGIWQAKFDSGSDNQHWGNLSWQQAVPGDKQSIEISVRASNDLNFTGVNWRSASDWNTATLATKVGRYLEIKVIVHSNQRGVTPAVCGLKVLKP